jgi:hypothetical protein
MGYHTLGCCSSSKLCGHILRGSESRRCICHDKPIEQSRGAPYTREGGFLKARFGRSNKTASRRGWWYLVGVGNKK